MTSHISPQCVFNPNAPTFGGQSADNHVLHSSPGLQTSKDMITKTISELNISNTYFTADIEEVKSQPPNLNDTATKVMTSYLTETDSNDEISECKHCNICNLLITTTAISVQYAYVRS